MNLPLLKSIAAIVLMLSLTSSIIWITHRVDVGTRKAEELSAQAGATLARTHEYVDFQLDMLQSQQGQALIRHNLQIGEATLLSIQKLNRTTIPTINAAGMNLNYAAKSLTDFISNTDHSVNQDLLPAATALLKPGTITLQDVSSAVNRGIEAGLLTIEQANKILTDPAIFQTLKNFEASSGHFDEFVKHMGGVAANFEEASKKWPSLFDLFEKYQKTVNKYQKWLILASILSLLSGLIP